MDHSTPLDCGPPYSYYSIGWDFIGFFQFEMASKNNPFGTTKKNTSVRGADEKSSKKAGPKFLAAFG